MGTQTLVPNQYRLHKWDGPLELKETGGAMVTGNIAVIPPDDADVRVESLSVTENGTYTAPEGTAYSPVTVNVPTSGGSFEPYGCRINEYYPSYICIFPHGSEYTRKIYSHSKLYSSSNSTFADKYTSGFLVTSGNSDLNVHSVSGDNFNNYYLPVEPLGSENPSSEGWYEQYDHEGTLELRQTSDTAIVEGKTYYKSYSDGNLYIVFEYNNKQYGLTTDSSNTLIEIPVQP